MVVKAKTLEAVERERERERTLYFAWNLPTQQYTFGWNNLSIRLANVSLVLVCNKILEEK